MRSRVPYATRDPVKNYFPLPNEIFTLGLSAGAIAVYGYLMQCENRKTYAFMQKHPLSGYFSFQ